MKSSDKHYFDTPFFWDFGGSYGKIENTISREILRVIIFLFSDKFSWIW